MPELNVFDRFIDRLPDNYNKSKDSNVTKLAKLTTGAIQQNEDTLIRIGAWRDIDQAEGVALDYIGRDVQQARGLAPDATYRVLIKARIKANLASGTIDDIIDFVSFILQITPQEVAVRELWKEGKPATIHVSAPMGPIASTGLTARQFAQIVDRVAPPGVGTESLFEGTFRLTEIGAPDSPFGLGNLEGTTGGTLSYLFQPGDDYELPD